MAEVDTSSYPTQKAPPKSPVEQATDYGKLASTIETVKQQKIGVEQKKLDLVKDQWSQLSRDLAPLALKKDLTQDDVVANIDMQVKKGLIQPNQAAAFKASLPPNATPEQLQTKIRDTVIQGQSVVDALHHVYGKEGMVNTPQGVYPVNTGSAFVPPRPMGPMLPNTMSQAQLNQPTEIVGPNGVRQTMPLQGFVEQTGGQTGAPQQFPTAGNNRLPVAPQAGPTGPQPPVQSAPLQPVPVPTQSIRPPVAPPQPAQRTSISGPGALFDEGKKQYAADQELATQRLTQIKPALQALPMLDKLTTGPGTETYNKTVALLSNAGLIPKGMVDKTAIYQEVSKKLAQYVSGNPVGQRSDSAQTLAEAASPSPKTQISPALIKLTRDAIALDRVQAARSTAFNKTNANGETIPRTDFENYGAHRALFPAGTDERAFNLDAIPKTERDDLIKEMLAKKNTLEGQKFFKSLQIAKDQKLIDPALIKAGE